LDRKLKTASIVRLVSLLFFVFTLAMFVFASVYSFSSLITPMSSTIPYQKALALAAIVRVQALPFLTPSSMTQNLITYTDLDDGISIKYPSGWEKIEYPAVPMSTAGYRVVVNFLAPIVNASDQWRDYLMMQVLDQSTAKSLVPQVKTTLAGNPGYKLVYTNNEESFLLKTLEVWTTIGDHTYLFIYKAEATKYSGYLPIIQRMLDSFKVGGSAGLSNSSSFK
jgi:eukaryotic-like serine/threonine-protein kinase